MKGSQHVDGDGDSGIHELLGTDHRPHLAKQCRLVLAVVKEGVVVVASENIEELSEEGLLLRRVIGPEGDHFLLPTLHDEQAKQIGEFPFGIAFGIEVDAHIRGRKGWFSNHEDSLLPNGEGLQGKGSRVLLRMGVLAAAGTVGVGKLRDGRDPLLRVLRELLLRDPPEQAQIVCLERLVKATRPELALLAVVLKNEARDRFAADHRSNLVEHLLGHPIEGREFDSPCGAFRATDRQASLRDDLLGSPQDQAADGEQSSLEPSHCLALMEEDGDVVELPKRRAILYTAHSIKAESDFLVFHHGGENDLAP